MPFVKFEESAWMMLLFLCIVSFPDTLALQFSVILVQEHCLPCIKQQGLLWTFHKTSKTTQARESIFQKMASYADLIK